MARNNTAASKCFFVVVFAVCFFVSSNRWKVSFSEAKSKQ